jgi:hypothetical protein
MKPNVNAEVITVMVGLDSLEQKCGKRCRATTRHSMVEHPVANFAPGTDKNFFEWLGMTPEGEAMYKARDDEKNRVVYKTGLSTSWWLGLPEKNRREINRRLIGILYGRKYDWPRTYNSDKNDVTPG